MLTNDDPARQLLPKLAAFIANRQPAPEEKPAEYNVFTTLFRHDHEVALHTRILKDLLDPDGNHGCGELFLNFFLAAINRSDLLERGPAANRGNSRWTVRREVNCGRYGNIDIVISRPGLTIAIENKTRRLEQPDQLKRYASYLGERSGASMLLFLTPHGWESTTAGGCKYVPISYRVHVLSWLAQCRQSACTPQHTPINEVLRQYTDVVQQLVGETPYTRMIDDAANFAIQTPGILRHRETILDVLAHARVRALSLIVQRLGDVIAPLVLTDSTPSFYDSTDGILEVGENESPGRGDYRIVVQYWTEKQWLIVGVETTDAFATTHASWFSRIAGLLKPDFDKGNGYSTWPVGWKILRKNFDDGQIEELIRSAPNLTALGLDLKEAIQRIQHAIAAVPMPCSDAQSGSSVDHS